MSAKRTQHTREFKDEAVRLATQQGASVPNVAASLGLSPNQLYRWIRAKRSDGESAFPGHGVSRDEELHRLRRELKRITEKRDFLKKTATFFASESR